MPIIFKLTNENIQNDATTNQLKTDWSRETRHFAFELLWTFVGRCVLDRKVCKSIYQKFPAERSIYISIYIPLFVPDRVFTVVKVSF
jgi:hypothetical protein